MPASSTCDAARAWRCEEAGPHHPEVEKVHRAIAVEIRIRIAAEEHFLQYPQIEEVHDVVVPQVRVADVAITVNVGVALVGFGDLSAVVLRGGDAVSVRVAVIGKM